MVPKPLENRRASCSLLDRDGADWEVVSILAVKLDRVGR